MRKQITENNRSQDVRLVKQVSVSFATQDLKQPLLQNQSVSFAPCFLTTFIPIKIQQTKVKRTQIQECNRCNRRNRENREKKINKYEE